MIRQGCVVMTTEEAKAVSALLMHAAGILDMLAVDGADLCGDEEVDEAKAFNAEMRTWARRMCPTVAEAPR